MSDAPPDRVHLGDMLEWARRIQPFVSGVPEDAFLDDERTQSAVIHGLIMIGEVAARVSEPTRAATALPWHAIRGMRNRLVHDYFGLDIDEVWRTATIDVPDLERLLRTALGDE